MKTIKPKELSAEEFLPYGFYANLIDAEGDKLGAPPIEFYRDMVQQNQCGDSSMSFSSLHVEKRDTVIDVLEYHTATSEGILPLDNDVIIYAAGATAPDGNIPLNKIEAFRLPKGTMAVLRPGVWHHAPFTVNDKPANILIVLPERAYANDCEVFELDGDNQIKVEP